jgi:enoyl-CoA hydratase/carnithine racemase
MELALACDLVIATDNARFAQPEIQLGCFPPVAAALYPALIGPQRAAELMLTNRALSSEEAQSWGLVNWRVPAPELQAKLDWVVAEIAGKSAAVVKLTKRALAAGRGSGFVPALAEAERIYLEELCHTADIGEGIAAYLEKRPPQWRHR